MKYTIRNCVTRDEIYTAEIAAATSDNEGIKKGLAAAAAVEAGVELFEADLEGADFDGTVLHGAKLYAADLDNATFVGATLIGTDFDGALMRSTNFHGASLHKCRFTQSKLTGSIFRKAELHDVDMRWAFLFKPDLREATLAHVKFGDASFHGPLFDGARFCNTAFEDVDGLEDIIIDGGMHSNGNRYLLTRYDPGQFRVQSWFCSVPVSNALHTVREGRPGNVPDAEETRALIEYMLAIANRRGWKVRQP